MAFGILVRGKLTYSTKPYMVCTYLLFVINLVYSSTGLLKYQV